MLWMWIVVSPGRADILEVNGDGDGDDDIIWVGMGEEREVMVSFMD